MSMLPDPNPASTDPNLDLFDPDGYQAGIPHEAFRRLRRQDPVHWQPLPPSGAGANEGYWALLKHADVLMASRSPDLFSAARQGIVIADPTPEELAQQKTQLLSMDPPEHGKLRRIVLEAFTPRAVDRLEDWLRERAREVLDLALGTSECDFADVAAGLPVQTVARLLGVSESDHEKLIELAQQMIGQDDPELAAPEGLQHAIGALHAYGLSLARERRAKPGDDLVSLMLRATIDGRPLDDTEFGALFLQIAVAANDTTRSLLSGSLLCLIEQPHLWDTLRSEPAKIPGAVEEFLRVTTPVHYFRRTATRDVELRGKRIRQGDRVVLQYSSANFDEEVFAEPGRLDIERDPNPHVSFGYGEHFCLGARLARLEGRVFLEELVERCAGATLCGPVRRIRSNITHSFKSIPLRLVPC